MAPVSTSAAARALQLPAITPVRTFQVDVRDGDVYLRLD